MVGIWGMGGVGKTTLLRKIYNSLLDDENTGFDYVILVVATKDVQLEKLREEIATKLQLISSSSKEGISNFLKTKNFVLLLDDIWVVVDLVELGIPHPHSNDNSTKQYKRKVIFTTRSEELCTKMRADEKIKVECLEPQEAWDLFKENVNLDVIESDVRMKEIARQVMNECRGLPLTLILIGKAMSNKKNFEEWDYVLRSMRKSKTSIIQDVEKSLYPTLEISYDNLPNKLCKDCFLYISLWPRGVGISNEDIIDFWIRLGLIHEFDNLREAYGHGQYILRLLEAACLLEPYEKAYMDFKKDLRLHDVIRDMALWIVAKSEARNIWIANANMGLNRISNVAAKKWRFAVGVSLMNNNIETLPKLTQQCSHLLSLMMQHNLNLKNIPDGFFLRMSNLRYLNLSETKLRRLPRDVKCLVNLQYLNISKTEISVLPSEMINLQNLQFLICQHLWWDHITPDGLVSKLLNLQVLDIYPNAEIKLKELNTLKENIKALGLCVTSLNVLQQLSELPTCTYV
ncbi:disease resistance protein UNI-like [Dioscorea cayenensis subsp. rotundata]|uniref:Disease resistance protein UNI-like n=1 Tax=Dioscorea cayennensis subsp. rotundata TaxID=55577 RepID=A0AB40CDK7_DIOCR|nr:disease resistance protein UNI-like [Dioscorea cayenensis subsp. rotundata]XP_039137187.1 disease resistance protein UNI-like [Dioscorea cayenensis subsp. rotundata]XP_039137188.1 disease resistance protein UNI-like [Dioscorea cayenensis subsp. rotundata]XP_039137189.1 disease resistance protein UNI-like [Dioscorea cayenensis subsp. rotundata]